MINRRHIRVKVMQSVYAFLQSKSDILDKEEKFLLFKIEKLQDLYVLMLQLLIEIRNEEKNHLELSKKKILATAEELNPNLRFVNNTILTSIRKSKEIAEYLEKFKLNYWYLDAEYPKNILKQIKNSNLYKSYMNAKEVTYNEEKQFIANIYKEIIAPDPKLYEYLEDKNIGWIDDFPYVNTRILKTLSKIKPETTLRIGRLYKDEEDKKFVLDLFRKTVLNHTEYEKEIVDKTPNWDTDRIADLDMILIKMAITEFLKFPQIPTKVSMNEYIEISKDYSTPKSSFFINGVLDKVLKDLKKTERLNKVGRGLL